MTHYKRYTYVILMVWFMMICITFLSMEAHAAGNTVFEETGYTTGNWKLATGSGTMNAMDIITTEASDPSDPSNKVFKLSMTRKASGKATLPVYSEKQTEVQSFLSEPSEYLKNYISFRIRPASPTGAITSYSSLSLSDTGKKNPEVIRFNENGKILINKNTVTVGEYERDKWYTVVMGLSSSTTGSITVSPYITSDSGITYSPDAFVLSSEDYSGNINGIKFIMETVNAGANGDICTSYLDDVKIYRSVVNTIHAAIMGDSQNIDTRTINIAFDTSGLEYTAGNKDNYLITRFDGDESVVAQSVYYDVYKNQVQLTLGSPLQFSCYYSLKMKDITNPVGVGLVEDTFQFMTRDKSITIDMPEFYTEDGSKKYTHLEKGQIKGKIKITATDVPNQQVTLIIALYQGKQMVSYTSETAQINESDQYITTNSTLDVADTNISQYTVRLFLWDNLISKHSLSKYWVLDARGIAEME